MTFADSSALAMLDHTSSQIHVRRTSGTASELLTFTSSQWGDYFGTPGNWTWTWDFPTRSVKGLFIATATAKLSGSVQVVWSIISLSDGNRHVLSTGTVKLGPDRAEFCTPFWVQPNGGLISFEIEISGKQAKSITAGWREIRIPHVGDSPDEPVPPGLNITGNAQPANLPDGSLIQLRVSGETQLDGEKNPLSVPFEAWKSAPEAGKLRQAVLHVSPQNKPDSTLPIVMLVWCKSTRLEILHQEALPIESGTFTIEGRTPESGGWLGLVVRPLEREKSLKSRLHILQWSKYNASNDH